MKWLLVPQGAVIVRFSDSPLYGMLDIRTRLNQQMPAMVQQLISAQRDTDAVSI
ncbi:hypothetical protein [Arsukibacterium perlucidum]|uniref:hypothetical protein n=1 Tax=Arsukibacterium perlucidum TaxID=368811 RepID=UPI000365AAAD|nr:hypothetical protein [Arsukibacterium perlucidum]